VRLLFVLGALAILATAGFLTSPKQEPNPEEVQAYYIQMLGRADQIAVHRPDATDEPVIITRADEPGFFSRLAMTARYGLVAGRPSPYKPKWILDVSMEDGTRIKDVAVGYHLEAPKQPAKGHLWLFPGTPGQRQGAAPMVELIDELVASVRPDASEQEESEETAHSARP